MGTLPRVAVLFTGGTISMMGRDRVDLLAYRETGKRLTDAELIARVPELARVAQVTPTPFATLESTALTNEHWVDLVSQIEGLFAREEADGVVVTHGTNTLDETAYFLHLALTSSRPVVITGSMRPASSLSFDGDLNLMRAVAVAATPEASGKGVLVVLDETIVSARDVVKAETTRLHAFQGRDVGPLGFADRDGVRFQHLPARPHTGATAFVVQSGTELPTVHMTISYVTADGIAIDAITASGADGIVLAGTGSGAGSPAELAALDRAGEAGMAVCIATRVPAGRVPRTPEFVDRGFVAAGDLPPWKARILLGLSLTLTKDPDELQRFFDTY